MSAVLDYPPLPAVDAPPPSAMTAVAVAAGTALDLTKVDLADVALAQFGQWRPAVAKLKADNAVLVLDLSKQSQVDEAKSLRERTINKPMADARKVSKALKSKLTEVSKSVGEELEALVLAYDEAGKPLTALIDDAQKKIDDAKEAERQAKETRLSGLRATVDEFMQTWLDRASAEGITAERIGAGMAKLTDLVMPTELADVAGHWTTTKAATLVAMTKLQLDKLLADKAERDREDADIEKLTELANDCVARGAQYIEDTIGELDNVLAPTLSSAARVQTVATAARVRMVALLETAKETEAARARAAATVAAIATADAPDSAAGNAENPEPVLEAAPEFTEAPTPTGEGKAGTPDAGNVEAAPEYSEGQHPQQVLKAEPETADATDRGTAADASPGVGPMGVGQPADAGPAGETITQDAQESGSLPADAPAPRDDAVLYASNGAQAAQALPSGEQGQAAHAEERAADPAHTDTGLAILQANGLDLSAGDEDDTPIETSEREAITPAVLPAVSALDEMAAAVLASPLKLRDELAQARADLAGLVAHLNTAFDCRFPTHPKPPQSWWTELRARIDALQAREGASL